MRMQSCSMQLWTSNRTEEVRKLNNRHTKPECDQDLTREFFQSVTSSISTRDHACPRYQSYLAREISCCSWYHMNRGVPIKSAWKTPVQRETLWLNAKSPLNETKPKVRAYLKTRAEDCFNRFWWDLGIYRDNHRQEIAIIAIMLGSYFLRANRSIQNDPTENRTAVQPSFRFIAAWHFSNQKTKEDVGQIGTRRERALRIHTKHWMVVLYAVLRSHSRSSEGHTRKKKEGKLMRSTEIVCF